MANHPPMSDQVAPQLPPAVEQAIQVICQEQALPPLTSWSREKLSTIGEHEALKILDFLRGEKIRNFDAYLTYKIQKVPTMNYSSPARPKETALFSPNVASSSPHDSAGGSSKGSMCRPLKQATLLDFSGSMCSPLKQARLLDFSAEGEANFGATSPHIRTLDELEFKRAFLILSYSGKGKLENVTSPDEIQRLHSVQSFLAFEHEVWSKFGQKNCDPKDRLKNFEWTEGKRFNYHCHVRSDGTYYFKGPFLNKAATHLQRSLRDENVLLVKFESEEPQSSRLKSDTPDCTAISKVFTHGIYVGRKCFRFFVFKDGGKEEKKKNPSSNPVKCYFVDVESFASSIQEARSLFMHIHTAPNLSKYVARFSLVLSKTVKMEVDLDEVCVQDIKDIPCLTENGELVHDIDGKPMIQTDGTGFISEDLALMCPRVIRNSYTGTVKADNRLCEFREQFLDSIRSNSQSEPPLLIQCRIFNNGRAIKGTLLVNKKLPPKTIQVRPSMIKVETDPDRHGARSINSIEIVGISNKPKKPRLSKNLIALLVYGGVPKEYFLGILADSLLNARSARSNRKAALEVALTHGDMDDDLMLARLIASGVPLEEPYLQHRLSYLVEEEKKSLKSGKLHIPDSYYVMGSADPTGVLKSNEVCVILENGQLSGKVLVYRNPGLHFGDIHVVDAVYVKDIEEVVGSAKYGILFSTKGPRSMGDEIAGGDYDGDMYWVSRNPQLLEYFKPSAPWTCMHSSPSMPSVRPSTLSPEELEQQLFRLFMTARFQPSATPGSAANCWTSFMDRLLILGDDCSEEKQILKEKMLKLIDLYYDSLDAYKTEKKVEIPQTLAPKKFPHHMEGHESLMYKSTSILGKIYDTVIEYRELEPPIQVWKLPYFDVDVGVEVPEVFLQQWGQNYIYYRREMTDALKLEGEVKNDATAEIYRKYTREVYGADGLELSPKSWEEIRLQALAVYNVVYDHAKNHSQTRYCWFAWKVAGSALLKMVLDQQSEKPLCIPPSVLIEIFSR